MTPTQYDRWQAFATRMALACYASHRRPTGAWILERVEDFVTNLYEPLTIIDWDNSTDGADLAGDLMARYEEEFEPEWAFDDRIDVTAPGGYDRLWELQMKAHEQYSDQFFGPVRCCVRAGLDIASAPSAGVLGFGVGDLRKMYPEGIPDWIAGFFGQTDIRQQPDSQALWL